MNYSYEDYKKSADYILSKIDFKPEIALVLGSSLGSLADEIEDRVVIDYKDIPNFLISTAPSHAGKLILGRLAGKNIVCLSGRFHYYEGYDFEELVIPVRVCKLLGVESLILTNIAGAINTSYKRGDIMIIEDHIKLFGASPLRGKNIDEFGERFFDTSNMYTRELRELAKEAAEKINLDIREGIYFYAGGPQLETPAEIRAMRMLGGDAVGMSTVTESITAAHCGMKLLGLSLMSNMAAGVEPDAIDDDQVVKTVKEASIKFKELIREIIENI